MIVSFIFLGIIAYFLYFHGNDKNNKPRDPAKNIQKNKNVPKNTEKTTNNYAKKNKSNENLLKNPERTTNNSAKKNQRNENLLKNPEKPTNHTPNIELQSQESFKSFNLTLKNIYNEYKNKAELQGKVLINDVITINLYSPFENIDSFSNEKKFHLWVNKIKTKHILIDTTIDTHKITKNLYDDFLKNAVNSYTSELFKLFNLNRDIMINNKRIKLNNIVEYLNLVENTNRSTYSKESLKIHMKNALTHQSDIFKLQSVKDCYDFVLKNESKFNENGSEQERNSTYYNLIKNFLNSKKNELQKDIKVKEIALEEYCNDLEKYFQREDFRTVNYNGFIENCSQLAKIIINIEYAILENTFFLEIIENAIKSIDVKIQELSYKFK